MLTPKFKIKTQKKSQDYGLFIIEPLEEGYGHTIGNALRRVLLSSLPGFAITMVKIKGIKHQFSKLKGLKEDIVEFILNLKLIKLKSSLYKKTKITLKTHGPGEITASQIKTPPTIEIVNKDLVLGHLADKKSTIEMEMFAEGGLGYSPAEERKSSTLGEIPIDASFGPINRVNFKVETTRVGRMTNYDKLILEIWTDGTTNSKDALLQSAKILSAYFTQIYKPRKIKEAESEEKAPVDKNLELTIEELGFPTRIVNSLRKANYNTVKDLTAVSKSEIQKVKNLGAKSMKIIEAALKEKKIFLKE
jgi:DNA-directed RNA polymerase subunit alpha